MYSYFGLLGPTEGNNRVHRSQDISIDNSFGLIGPDEEALRIYPTYGSGKFKIIMMYTFVGRWLLESMSHMLRTRLYLFLSSLSSYGWQVLCQRNVSHVETLYGPHPSDSFSGIINSITTRKHGAFHDRPHADHWETRERD